MSAPVFPLGLGSRVELVAATCPLGEPERRLLEAAGFEIPQELARAVESRRDEFAAGRYCAWQALRRLDGDADARIEVGPDRAPRWPAGFVGSIAHAHGRAAAAVARADQVAGVGIDCEPAMPDARSAPLRDRILTAHDEAVISVPGSATASWRAGEQVTFVFSAKEAIYKCLRPLCGQFFGFEAAALVGVDAGQGTFEFELLEPVGGEFGAGWRGQGRFARQEGWFFTGVLLERR